MGANLIDSSILREPREAMDFISNILESSTEYSIIGLDLAGSILLWNEGARRIYGYEPDEILGKANAEILYAPADVALGKPGQIMDTVLHSGKWEGTFNCVRKDGQDFIARVVMTPRYDANRNINGFLLISKNISSEIYLTEELKASQFYTRSLIESNIDAMMATDPLGIITDVNLQMCEITGRSREELIGTIFKDYFTDLQRAEDGIRKVLTEGRVSNYELIIKAGDGRETIISYNATTFQGTDGRLRGVFAAVRDISEQKAMEEQLRRKNEELELQNHRIQEANRLKSEFLANMSHELRTPLNGIIGFTEMMYDGEAGEVSAVQHEYLGDVLSSSRHLLQLINDVLDLSKVEAGKMTFYPEKIDLERVVGEVQDILRLLINKKRIRFRTEIDTILNEVVIDSAKFKQVLYNYLSNALKFTSNEGQVTVRIKPEGDDNFLLEVEDSGTGIRPEDIGRLFIEFQQLDSDVARKQQGTGLGLSLTKHIVEAQGGRVGVHSVPGQGSTFFAVLPRVNTTIEEFTEQESNIDLTYPALPPLKGSRTILVIEDNPRDRNWLVRSLAEAGYTVETAATAAEALQRSQEQAFDMITLDLLLPDASGWEVMRRIRASGPNRDAPIIVVTLVAEKNVSMGLPVHDILSKPVQADVLLASLQRAVRERAGIDPDGQE